MAFPISFLHNGNTSDIFVPNISREDFLSQRLKITHASKNIAKIKGYAFLFYLVGMKAMHNVFMELLKNSKKQASEHPCLDLVLLITSFSIVEIEEK